MFCIDVTVTSFAEYGIKYNKGHIAFLTILRDAHTIENWWIYGESPDRGVGGAVSDPEKFVADFLYHKTEIFVHEFSGKFALEMAIKLV